MILTYTVDPLYKVKFYHSKIFYNVNWYGTKYLVKLNLIKTAFQFNVKILGNEHRLLYLEDNLMDEHHTYV